MEHSMHVKLLGVRGTLPVHGAEFSEFGGATSCVLIKAGGEAFVLDAGTGLQGRAFREFFPGRRFSMFITHSHVDHLMGFPAFPPLFDSSFCGDVWLKTRGGLPARSQIEALMAPPLWPIKTDALKADIRFHDVESRFSVGEVLVETMEANHPGGSTIYKLTFGGVSVVYATDYEPLNDAPDDFCEFARDCSLLLIDAQYTSEEYLRTKGFGHSTLKRSAAIAANCGARQTIFVHHDPSRTDRQLSEWEEKLQNENPALRFGRGGEEIVL